MQRLAPALATGMIVGDCATTLALPANGFIESNPLLGTLPSAGEVVTWCGLALVTTAAVADLLPSHWRQGWWLAIALIESVYLLHNLSILW